MLCVSEKNIKDKIGREENILTYNEARCQKRVLPTHENRLKICYLKTIENSVYDDTNAIHAWNRFKTNLGKGNLYRYHFSLHDEQRKFFVDLFNIDFRKSLKTLYSMMGYKNFS